MKKNVIKAWAVVNSRGKINMEKFFTKDYMQGHATLAIFPYGNGSYEKDKPNALWGYAVGKEKVVPVEIHILPPTSKPKKDIFCLRCGRDKNSQIGCKVYDKSYPRHLYPKPTKK